MNLVERALRQRRAGRFLSCLALAIFIPRIALAADPIVSSNFAGQEDPLSENALWEPLNSMSPDGIRFQKNNGLAYQNGYNAAHNNHAGARMAAAAGVPNDHYAEIVVGHIGPPPAGDTVPRDYVGAWVRLQPSGPAIDSGYLYWGTNGASGENNWLYRIVANGSSYSAAKLIQHSPFADGDRVRLIARGPVIYGIHNGVREFIYNSGPDGDGCPAAPNCPPRYDTGTTGMLSFVQVPPVTDASISSWATGAAPASSGVWASTTFSGVEDPLDEGDRWYPLPGYQGFRKAGGLAIGRDINQHNISGVWSIAPPQKQYSEVTLGPVSPAGSGGGGGPVVRIDRTNLGQTGYLLFLYVDNPSASGVYKIVPGNFLLIGGFSTPPTLLAGDKWRLTADGNTLTVSNNGVFQFSVTDPNSTYPTGDVGMEAFKSAFTFMGWEGGDPAAAGTVQSPTISGFTPASGPVGTSVTISGTNFTGASAVAFNGTSATFSVTSATAIQATVPAGATSGPISVTTPGGTATSSGSFTVVNGPVISGFTPSSGRVGTSVTISGSGFTGATAVAFNGTSASFTVSSDTAIQTTVPAGATSGPISVTTPGGTATSSGSFTVGNGPGISGFTPASGPAGTSVTISGSGFTGATAVAFNGTSASFTVSSDTAIQTSVPAGATSGPISVTTPGGTATSSSAFSVVKPPAISGFSPASGTAGTSVTISGTGFSGATAVAFNGTSATFTVSSDTAIQTSVPAGATSGPLSVTTPGGTATSSGAFTVLKAPGIFSFTPTTGRVGTSVTISGSGFTGATAVAFNGVSASFTVSSDTAIQTAVPAGATTGPLSVTTSGGTANSANAFTVLIPPTIASLSPASGRVGTAVTINGTNLTGATSVAFNGVGASFTVSSDTAIQTAVPAGATSGPVSVTTSGGTAQSPGAFTVVAPPTIASFTPASGPVGTTVTISGSGLTAASSVKFNGVGATFTVQSDAAIQAIVPSGAGTGLVSVTTAAGTATSASSFTVTVPTVPLTVVRAGNGQGSVTSTSDRPPIGTSYQVGTVVTLTATPATGSNFTSWTGCDSVSGATCTVTMNAARSVTATFTLQTFPLTVTKSHLLTGNGTVTSTSSPGSAAQINCGSNCSVSFNYGTVVTLTASPALLSLFSGWTGCDSVSGNVCTVTIRAARSVNAAFLP